MLGTARPRARLVSLSVHSKLAALTTTKTSSSELFFASILIAPPSPPNVSTAGRLWTKPAGSPRPRTHPDRALVILMAHSGLGTRDLASAGGLHRSRLAMRAPHNVCDALRDAIAQNASSIALSYPPHSSRPSPDAPRRAPYCAPPPVAAESRFRANSALRGFMFVLSLSFCRSS